VRLSASSHRRPDDQALLDTVSADATRGSGSRCGGEAVVVVGGGEGRPRRRDERGGRAQRLKNLLSRQRPAAAPRHGRGSLLLPPRPARLPPPRISRDCEPQGSGPPPGDDRFPGTTLGSPELGFRRWSARRREMGLERGRWKGE
jgi:hypothetical protein